MPCIFKPFCGIFPSCMMYVLLLCWFFDGFIIHFEFCAVFSHLFKFWSVIYCLRNVGLLIFGFKSFSMVLLFVFTAFKQMFPCCSCCFLSKRVRIFEEFTLTLFVDPFRLAPGTISRSSWSRALFAVTTRWYRLLSCTLPSVFPIFSRQPFFS